MQVNRMLAPKQDQLNIAIDFRNKINCGIKFDINDINHMKYMEQLESDYE